MLMRMTLVRGEIVCAGREAQGGRIVLKQSRNCPSFVPL